jgi:uncharacterized protein (DUF58 family)
VLKNAWQSLQASLENYAVKKQKIYIIPTKHGLIYTGIMFAIFLIGLSYGNNLTLACAFILFTYFIIEMLTTHRNIQELDVLSLSLSDEFANRPVSMELHLAKLAQAESYGITTLGGQFRLINHGLFLKANLSLSRGKYHVQNPKLFNTGHTDLFYAWKYLATNKTFFVYPTPKMQKQFMHHENVSNKQATDEEDFHCHVVYQNGLSAKRIDWKAFAKTESLYLKKFSSPIKSEILINYNDYLGEPEDRLSAMTYTLQEAYKQGLVWSLVLPKTSKWKANSYQDYHNCLRMLAEV